MEDKKDEAPVSRNEVIYKVDNYRQGSPEVEIDHYIPEDGSPDEITRGRWHVVAPYVYPLGIKINSGIGNAVFQMISMQGTLEIVPLGDMKDPLIGLSGVVQWDIPDDRKMTFRNAFKLMRAELPTHIKTDVDKLVQSVAALNKKQIALPSASDVKNFGG